MRTSFALAALCATAICHAQTPVELPAPLYATSSIVNAASNQAGPLAPNCIVSLYGSNLAWATRGLTAADIRNEMLPTALLNGGVRVLIGSLQAHLYFVSPKQVNLLVPSNLLPGKYDLRLSLDSRYGPAVKVEIGEASPALFQADPEFAIAMHGIENTPVTRENPARPGEIVVLYATGLGQTKPKAIPGAIVSSAAPLARTAEFQLELNGSPIDPARIHYAGLAPGFAGLYQINVALPEGTPVNPEIRVGWEGQMSPGKILLPVAAARQEGN